jgi:adenylate cyclase class IV
MREMADDWRETEIKLLIAAERPTDVIDAIAHLSRINGRLLGRARTSILRDTYFDKPDRQLYDCHFNLRIRREDGSLLSTLKGPKKASPVRRRHSRRTRIGLVAGCCRPCPEAAGRSRH